MKKEKQPNNNPALERQKRADRIQSEHVYMRLHVLLRQVLQTAEEKARSKTDQDYTVPKGLGGLPILVRQDISAAFSLTSFDVPDGYNQQLQANPVIQHLQQMQQQLKKPGIDFTQQLNTLQATKPDPSKLFSEKEREYLIYYAPMVLMLSILHVQLHLGRLLYNKQALPKMGDDFWLKNQSGPNQVRLLENFTWVIERLQSRYANLDKLCGAKLLAPKHRFNTYANRIKSAAYYQHTALLSRYTSFGVSMLTIAGCTISVLSLALTLTVSSLVLVGPILLGICAAFKLLSLWLKHKADQTLKVAYQTKPYLYADETDNPELKIRARCIHSVWTSLTTATIQPYQEVAHAFPEFLKRTRLSGGRLNRVNAVKNTVPHHYNLTYTLIEKYKRNDILQVLKTFEKSNTHKYVQIENYTIEQAENLLELTHAACELVTRHVLLGKNLALDDPDTIKYCQKLVKCHDAFTQQNSKQLKKREALFKVLGFEHYKQYQNQADENTSAAFVM